MIQPPRGVVEDEEEAEAAEELRIPPGLSGRSLRGAPHLPTTCTSFNTSQFLFFLGFA
jgi:hypothetical protein